MTKRKITPHKGGRSISRRTDVTPATNEILRHLWTLHKISLGDLVEEIAKQKADELNLKAG